MLINELEISRKLKKFHVRIFFKSIYMFFLFGPTFISSSYLYHIKSKLEFGIFENSFQFQTLTAIVLLAVSS